MPTAKIHTKQARHTLEKLHAELGGKILDNQAEAKRLAEAMKHVEAVLKLLIPGYDVRPIAVRRRKSNPWFKKGTVLRAALDVLRTAERPLTTREITLRMVAAKDVTNPDAKAVRELTSSVSSCLNNYRDRSVVSRGGHPEAWAIKP